MAEPLELKKTLNLPKTNFPMKASLPENEPKQLAAWYGAHLYERILEARKGQPLFVLHDGPPYPTGEIHLGTGLNKILKDLIVKTKSMAGYYAPYVPGWDCHGLPIETQVEKELGGKGKVPPAEFRKLCREFATRYVEQHKRDFKRLGIFGQWNDPYLTMSFDYEATIAGAFLDFMEKGYVYRGRKPVYWCIYDSTALAEAEVEYEDHSSPSIYVRYKLVQDGAPAQKIPAELKGKNVYAIIWTTTPWTIPASMALAFNPAFPYAAVETDGEVEIVAAQLEHAVWETLGRKGSGKTLKTYSGQQLAEAGLKFQHPFLNRTVPAVLADYVELDQGTGIVHTAPGHGADDFLTGQKYGLETYAPIDDKGVYLEGLPEYKGKDVFAANPIIVKLLADRGALLANHPYKHSYPHCWRCHNPVIFRATEQWFIKMDQTGKGRQKTLRQEALEEIHQVKWIPAWGEDRMHEMIEKRPDWTVSRQRFWGVPIIVFYCQGCGKRLEDYTALRHVVKWFEKEGADAWYQHSPEELLPRGTKCACGASHWRKENDILDVWFDSGSSHLAVLKGPEWPADVYLEGPDQYRGWFHSSLLVATGTRDAAPYRSVVTHGWTLDEQGRPMSKSLGNALYPIEICERWGADLLRLWVASVEYQADVKMSERVMTQLSEAYRKIRNTFRFALSNLGDFDPTRDALANAELEEIDQWMLDRTADLVKKCREWYANYEFHRVYHAIHDYCVVDLSALYFDVLKDRLYTKARKNKSRRSAQTAVWKIADALVRLAAPVLVFTAEEIWKHLPKTAGAPESVHQAVFPEAVALACGIAAREAERWERLAQVRSAVLLALEQARASKAIGGGLEAKVRLHANAKAPGLQELLREKGSLLPALFIVSQVVVDPRESDGLVPSETLPGLAVKIERADGKKCERCWNYSSHVGENARYPTVCERCSEALEEIESDGTAGVAANG
ncbi:MAG: isoleucine--tRNA ligase [Acidobacteria bacterium]|nr:MAG: isoleucine--tRNA ligase [Acidobacteria bacterium 13_2_20CM_58_27]PYT90019.1 MAG: isoleucine--tRNA ligase [Acidobacteriota bacterium]